MNFVFVVYIKHTARVAWFEHGGCGCHRVRQFDIWWQFFEERPHKGHSRQMEHPNEVVIDVRRYIAIQKKNVYLSL